MASFNMNQEIEELVTATLTEKLLISNSDNNNGSNNNKSEHKNMTDESAKNPNFFQDNKSVKKPERKYTIACIESRNFLSNISYVGINKKDFYHENLKKRFAAMGIWNNYWTFKAKWKNSMSYWKITFLSSKIFFYMVILMYTPRYTVLPIEKASIWKVYFILYLKPTKTKKLNIWEKNPKLQN